MIISNGIRIIDLALYLEKHKTLVISDVHLGFEEALNKKGMFIPRFQYKITIERLEKILKGLKLDNIIITGDLKHEFGEISHTEWRDTLNFLDFLSKHCKKIVLIKGNHDILLGPIAKKKNIEIVDSFFLDNTIILHGDKIPETIEFSKAKTVIIGHEHPAISISSEVRTETYKCFLVGKFKNKKLIVLPSFNLLVEGTNILKERILSPFLQSDLSNFEVYVIGDKIYRFGSVKEVKTLPS
ncbi:metallophosphoesterase [Candidatus Woesearchaeota archaeon]|nr:metallophosphoesterase [Candidatus Woesearchaeota archaeon]